MDSQRPQNNEKSSDKDEIDSEWTFIDNQYGEQKFEHSPIGVEEEAATPCVVYQNEPNLLDELLEDVELEMAASCVEEINDVTAQQETNDELSDGISIISECDSDHEARTDLKSELESAHSRTPSDEAVIFSEQGKHQYNNDVQPLDTEDLRDFKMTTPTLVVCGILGGIFAIAVFNFLGIFNSSTSDPFNSSTFSPLIMRIHELELQNEELRREIQKTLKSRSFDDFPEPSPPSIDNVNDKFIKEERLASEKHPQFNDLYYQRLKEGKLSKKVWTGDDGGAETVVDKRFQLPEYCRRNIAEDDLFSKYNLKNCEKKMRKIEQRLERDKLKRQKVVDRLKDKKNNDFFFNPYELRELMKENTFIESELFKDRISDVESEDLKVTISNDENELEIVEDKDAGNGVAFEALNSEIKIDSNKNYLNLDSEETIVALNQLETILGNQQLEDFPKEKYFKKKEKDLKKKNKHSKESTPDGLTKNCPGGNKKHCNEDKSAELPVEHDKEQKIYRENAQKLNKRQDSKERIESRSDKSVSSKHDKTYNNKKDNKTRRIKDEKIDSTENQPINNDVKQRQTKERRNVTEDNFKKESKRGKYSEQKLFASQEALNGKEKSAKNAKEKRSDYKNRSKEVWDDFKENEDDRRDKQEKMKYLKRERPVNSSKYNPVEEKHRRYDSREQFHNLNKRQTKPDWHEKLMHNREEMRKFGEYKRHLRQNNWYLQRGNEREKSRKETPTSFN